MSSFASVRKAARSAGRLAGRVVAVTSLVGVVLAAVSASQAAAAGNQFYAYAGSTTTGLNACPQTSITANQCTLTEALDLVDSDSNASGDVVYLATPGSSEHYVGTFSLSPQGTISSDPADEVTLEPAPGVPAPVLDGDADNSSPCPTSSCAGPVLTIGGGYVAVSGITLENGAAQAGTSCDTEDCTTGNGGDGGGIYNDGTLTLTGDTVTDDQAGAGGVSYYPASSSAGNGGEGGGIYSTGALTLTNTTVSDNQTGAGGNLESIGRGAGNGGDGGGIYSTGALTVTNSTVSDNQTGTGGTGGPAGGGNGGDGGGIYSAGTLSLTDSTISGNETGGGSGGDDSGGNGGNGGGIYAGGGGSIELATVSGNDGGGGGLAATGSGGNGGNGGGLFVTGGSALSVIGSTVSANESGGGGAAFAGSAANGGDGGGVADLAGGAVTLTASTVSANQTGAGGDDQNYGNGGNGGSGGGVADDGGGALSLTALTVSGNQTGGGGSQGSQTPNDSAGSAGVGGGLYSGSGTVTLTASILSGLADGSGTNAPSNCAGPIVDGGYNVVDDSSCDLSSSSLQASDSQIGLGALSDNGGPTQTEAIGASSLAYHLVPAADCSSPDQRGVPRPQPPSPLQGQGSHCDAGAFEFAPPSVPSNTQAVAGQTVELDGYGFTLASSVTVGGNPVDYTVVSDTEITFTAPPTEGSTTVTVTNPDGSDQGSLNVQYGADTAANAASTSYSSSQQSVPLSATVSSAATVNEGTVTFTVTGPSSEVVGTPQVAGVTDGSAEVAYPLPAGTAVGTYTIGVTYQDPGGTFTDGGDTASTLTVVGPPSNVTPPTITDTTSGTSSVTDGDTLSASPGSWDSPQSLVYTYRWWRCPSDETTGTGCKVVGSGPTHLLGWQGVGSYVSVVVTATDTFDQTGTATAQPVGPVADPPPPDSVTSPRVLHGHPLVSGQYVVATKGKWASPDPLTYRYQWLACPTATTPVTSCIQAGSDSSHYLLSSADIGDYITVTVTAADKEHQPTSATAKAAGPVKS